MPHVALVHDNFMGPTGMGVVVGCHANWLLDAGWTVTLVGENVPGSLAQRCRVIRVPAPRSLPAVPQHIAWCTRAGLALRGLSADIVHAHSPLLAGVADIVTSHFIAQPSYLRGTREAVRGASGVLRWTQATINRIIDDRAYRSIGDRCYVSFVSEFLRDEFTRCYGDPRGGWVLAPPAPRWFPVGGDERGKARRKFSIADSEFCVGYIGGSDSRKGVSRLRELAGESDLRLLLAGPGSEEIRVGERRGIGFVDIDEFHAACDVVVAPALFDSAPVAVLQAAARDIPVVTTETSGWAKAIARSGAGLVWNGHSPLAPVLRTAASKTTTDCRRRFLAEFDEALQRRRLLDAYRAVAEACPSAR